MEDCMYYPPSPAFTVEVTFSYCYVKHDDDDDDDDDGGGGDDDDYDYH
jgi:hypothetical protein